MKKETGLWIDHRQAIIVTLSEQGEDEIAHITSNMKKHVRYSGASHSETSPDHDDGTDDKRDRRFENHLDKYYDEVIAILHGADSILILGPGEAKGELRKRLEAHETSGGIVAVETADKMTEGQIATAVRRHFQR